MNRSLRRTTNRQRAETTDILTQRREGREEPKRIKRHFSNQDVSRRTSVALLCDRRVFELKCPWLSSELLPCIFRKCMQDVCRFNCGEGGFAAFVAGFPSRPVEGLFHGLAGENAES